MKIERISIFNFGPFYGRHKIEFTGDGSGIHIVRGNNGQGKTSIQRAILWCLYGVVYDRKGAAIKSTSLLNQTALRDGDYRYEVQIAFNHENQKWTINRKTSSLTHQETKYDANMELSIVRDGVPLPNADKEIERILPLEVSRFFFFDGEMLRDYEELLEENSHSMTKLRDSIERVLGIPYLKTASDDLSEVKKKMEIERNKLIKRLGGKEYDELANDLEEVSDEINTKTQRIDRLKRDIADLESKISEDRRRLLDLQAVKEDAKQLLGKESMLKDKESEKTRKVEEKNKLLSEYYKTLLNEMAVNLISCLEEEHNKRMEKYNKKQRLISKMEELEKAKLVKKCKLCGTELTPTVLEQIRCDIEDCKRQIEELTEIPELNLQFDHSRDVLNRIVKQGVSREKIGVKEEEIAKIDHGIAQLKAEIKEISDRLASSDQEEPRRIEGRVFQKQEELGRLKQMKDEEEREEIELLRIKSELEQKLNSIPRDELQELSRIIDRTDKLNQLFKITIAKYRDDRRKEVELKATEIFRRIRSKEYFAGLQINGNFGLNIVTENGIILDKAELRSAGEEQVVAFSLMGALNKAANVEAPVFMDTPFGRLDTPHGTKILRELPNFSSQVVLLVTDRELRKGDESVLVGKIKTDYTVIHKGQEEGSFIEHTRSGGS